MGKPTRTTVTLEPDVAAAVEELRRSRGLGVSDAVNLLARAGAAKAPARPRTYELTTHDLGLRIDVTNVADALDALGGDDL